MMNVQIAFLLAVLTAAAGQTSPNPIRELVITRVRQAVEELFTTADFEGHGYISLSDMSRIFNEYDQDGSNVVSKAEFVERFANRTGFLTTVGKGLFFDLDMNKDDILGPDDIQLYFAKIDTNDDGRIDHDEFANYFTELLEVLFVLAIRAEGQGTTTPHQ